jgi:hypothetical protein
VGLFAAVVRPRLAVARGRVALGIVFVFTGETGAFRLRVGLVDATVCTLNSTGLAGPGSLLVPFPLSNILRVMTINELKFILQTKPYTPYTPCGIFTIDKRTYIIPDIRSATSSQATR